jgi:hypothetical protein
MSAMESKTRATASHRLATSLRVRRLAPTIKAALAQDCRGAAQIDNETFISRSGDSCATPISTGGELSQIDRAFEAARCRIIPIRDRAEVSLCASA